MKRCLILAAAMIWLIPGVSRPDPADTFSRRVNVSQNPLKDSWMPRLFLDREGRPAITLVDDCNGCGASARLKWFKDGSWQDYSPPFATSPNYWSYVAFGPDDQPRLGWPCTNASTVTELCYSQYGAGGWSDPIILSNDDGLSSYGGKVVIDSNGIAHAFWNEVVSPDQPSKTDIFWRRLDNGAWSAPVNISHYAGAKYSVAQARAVADGRGGVHVIGSVTRSDDDYYSRLVYLHYDGASWSEPEVLPAVSGLAESPDVAADGEGRPGAVWEQWSSPFAQTAEVEIYYSSRNGAWSAPRRLSYTVGADANASGPTLAFDSADRPHAIWVETWYERSMLVYARGDGSGWEGPSLISAGLSENPNRPWIAIGPDDRLHLAFVSRDNYTDLTLNIYYASLDLTQDAALGQVWVPPVDAPLGTPPDVKATLVGERGSTRLYKYEDHGVKAGDRWLLWDGGPLTNARGTAALYALDVLDPLGAPIQVFQSLDPWVATRDTYSLSKGFDLSGDNVAWTLTRPYAAPPSGNKKPLLQGLNLESGAALPNITGATWPLVNRDRVV